MIKKYKLIKKSNKLIGNFTIGEIYTLKPYHENYSIIWDDDNNKCMIKEKSKIFKEHFLNINLERKEKLININKKWVII